MRLPYGALAIGIIGQVVVLMLTQVLGAFAVPCCDNPTPEIPKWYASIATPVHFISLLLPGFLCGFYVQRRPIFVGALAAGVGAFAWFLVGSHVIATLFPSRAVGSLGDFTNILAVLTSPQYVTGLIISAVCYAAVGGCAASAGFVLRGNVAARAMSANRAL
jgi:hypothetical protein